MDNPDQVRVMLDQAGLSEWGIVYGGVDEHALRGYLFQVQDEMESTGGPSSSPLILPVDQHFNVGVGLVAIGYVQSGDQKARRCLNFACG